MLRTKLFILNYLTCNDTNAHAHDLFISILIWISTDAESDAVFSKVPFSYKRLLSPVEQFPSNLLISSDG